MAYAVLASLILFIGASILGIVRLCIHYKYNNRAFKLLSEQSEKLRKEKDYFTKLAFKKQQEQLKQSQQVQPTLIQQKKVRK
jgi:acyl-CoA synthetase (AMP-forming)/AMP-acid ligase II